MSQAPVGAGRGLGKGWLRLRFRLGQTATLAAYRLAMIRQRHAGKIELSLWLIVTAIGSLLVSPLQSVLVSLIDHDGVNAIRGLLSTIGGAMIGATAIAASFILFALQVNVERLPHGLFRRFSTDARLMASVGGSLLLAIGGTALSLISDDEQISLAIVLGLAILALILRLLFYAYQRSLLLINPMEQLRLLHDGLVQGLGKWSRRVDALATLVELPEDPQAQGRIKNQLDLRRLAVIKGVPNWAGGVKTGISHAAAYARRAGESGDLEVAAHALTVMVSLNDAYIRAKGRTFFANQLVFDSPLVTDGIVNETLENLKRLHGVALARRDELPIEQIFETLAALVQLYGTIDYGSPFDSKSHALLAAAYLESAVQATVPSGLTDSVMRGVQALGKAANQFLAISRPQESVGLIRKISLIGSVGALKADHKPVTLVAMEQLRDITLNLIRLQEQDPGFAIREMREATTMLSRMLLQSPDTLMGGHSTYLGPIYSGTSSDSLQSKLADFANDLSRMPANHALAARVIANIEVWADGLYDSQKELLLLAAAQRSPFFFDIAHWITKVAEVMLVVAAAPAASDHSRTELRKHARWLIGALSWLPTDLETARFVESWSHLNNLLDLALQCRRHGELECYVAVQQMMLRADSLQSGSYPHELK